MSSPRNFPKPLIPTKPKPAWTSAKKVGGFSYFPPVKSVKETPSTEASARSASISSTSEKKKKPHSRHSKPQATPASKAYVQPTVTPVEELLLPIPEQAPSCCCLGLFKPRRDQQSDIYSYKPPKPSRM